jgi:sugar lactone lactonase YvrE
MTRRFTAQVATSEAYQLAEGAIWDDAEQQVLFVDIPAGDVHVGQLSGSEVIVAKTHHVDETVGAVASGAGGNLLVAGHQTVLLLTPTGEQTPVARLISPDQPRRLNDGACDPAGRYLVGTLSLGETHEAESLYQLDSAGRVSVIDDDLGLSNGIAWSPDGDILYSVDTTPGMVWARPYEAGSGRWGRREAAFHVSDGSPDGLCVDTDANLWVAVWGRGEVRRYSPAGDLLAVVTVPAPHTSSAAFVGRDRDRLLITTAKDDLSADELTAYPYSGHLFLADVEATGLPAYRWS